MSVWNMYTTAHLVIYFRMHSQRERTLERLLASVSHSPPNVWAEPGPTHIFFAASTVRLGRVLEQVGLGAMPGHMARHE